MSDGFDALVGVYGVTDLWVYVPDELSVEQLAVLDSLVDNGTHDDAGTDCCFRLLDEDHLEPVLSQLRDWGKRHEIERWSRWPTTWLPEGRDSARYSPITEVG